MQTTAQRYVREYKPTVSYARAAERRERVVTKFKKVKKRIPEKEAIARTIIRARPSGIIAREAIKRIPDIKKKVVPPIKRGLERVKDADTKGWIQEQSLQLGKKVEARGIPTPHYEPPGEREFHWKEVPQFLGFVGGMSAEILRPGEELYHKHITEPVSTWIGGERAKAIQKQEQFVTKRGEEYRIASEHFKDKWESHEKGEEFTGTQEQYRQYKEDYKQLQSKHTHYRLTKEKHSMMLKPSPARQFFRGAGELVAGIPGFIGLSAPRILIETTTTPTAAPGKLLAFGKGFYEFAKGEPFRAAGGVAIMAGIPFAKKLPVKPKISVGKFPKGKGYSFGIETLRRPSILKPPAYGGFKPMLTIGTGGLKRVSVGKPKIKGELFGKEPYTPTTPLETYLTAKAIPKEALKITEARGVRYYTIKSGVKPKKLKPIIDETLRQHGLTKSTGTVIKILRKEKADLYGSVTQKAAGRAVGREALARTPRDFDVRVKNPESFAKHAIEMINKAEGREAVIFKKGGVVVKKTGEKLFDAHSKEVPGYTLFGEEYLAYGLKEEPIIKTAERIRTTTLSEQATRKLHGAMKVTAEERVLVSEAGLRIKGRIAPTHVGRIKDIADYYFAEKANIEGLKLKGKFGVASKADIHLEKWLESWGADVKKSVKVLYKETVRKEGGTKAWLGSFEEMPFSPSKSYKLATQAKYVAPISVAPIKGIVPSYQIPSTVSEITTKPSAVPSAISSVISSIIPPPTLSTLPSASAISSSIISKMPSPSRIIRGVGSEITQISRMSYKPYREKPRKSILTSKPYKPKQYKPKLYTPYKPYKPYTPYTPYKPYKPYTPPPEDVYSYLPYPPYSPTKAAKIPIMIKGRKKKEKKKTKKKKQWEWLEEFTVQRPTELHFGAIESGIPKVSKVTMLPQITMADITPKPRKTKSLKGRKTNRSKKKKK